MWACKECGTEVFEVKIKVRETISKMNENGSGTGDIVFPTDKKINGETLEIIRKEISEIAKNKTGNKECRIVILNIVNLTDL